MNDFYIYNHKEIKDYAVTNHTVIFCPDQFINLENLKRSIKEYFQKVNQPDFVVIIGGEYINEILLGIFEKEYDNIFGNIPNFLRTHYKKNHCILTFNESGTLQLIAGKRIAPINLKKIIRTGLYEIFKNNGGEIKSQVTHHYVFPSGKHCNKFLRTGNVLINGSEIFFIAFNLLKYYNPQVIKCIYSDTSSINSLVFSVIELKRRFTANLIAPHVESFGSYEKFEKSKFTKASESIVFISSSTSGRILNRLVEQGDFGINQLVLIYYLGDQIQQYQSQIVCDLTSNETNEIIGLNKFETFLTSEQCKYCHSGSVPVKVSGDVFLLERPQINRILIGTKHAPKNISAFIEEFKSINQTGRNVLKCNFSELPSYNHEIYFDLKLLFENTDEDSKYWKKYDFLLSQYLSSHLKYIIYLEDEASILLAKNMQSRCVKLFKKTPQLISKNEIKNINPKEKTHYSVIIACSCLVTGKNLLYISRALRDFENMTITYFIGLARTRSKTYLDDIRKNLCQGAMFEQNTNVFVTVDSIHLPTNESATPWEVELKFLKDFISYCKRKKVVKKVILSLEKRENILIYSGRGRGLANSIFWDNVILNTPLEIRKNFAFYNFNSYHKQVSQADIYTTIASVINNLRNPIKDFNECLIQSEYVRNILSPSNFSRFNDGIIQASILRCANYKELSYDFEEEDSLILSNVIKNCIEYSTEEHGEALMEFLYALAIVKLRLKEHHLASIIDLIKERIKHPLVLAFASYIKDNVLSERKIDIFKKYNSSNNK